MGSPEPTQSMKPDGIELKPKHRSLAENGRAGRNLRQIQTNVQDPLDFSFKTPNQDGDIFASPDRGDFGSGAVNVSKFLQSRKKTDGVTSHQTSPNSDRLVRAAGDGVRHARTTKKSGHQI